MTSKAKLVLFFVSRTLLLVSSLFVIVMAACNLSETKPPKLVVQHRLGISLDGGQTTNDAGIVIDEGGIASIFLDAAVPSVLGEPAIDHCELPNGYIDFSGCVLSGRLVCGSNHQKYDQLQLTAVQCAALFNLLKTQFAADGIQ